MAPTKNQIKKKIELLKEIMINQMESADPGGHLLYYQGYAVGYAKGVDDALAFFD